MKSQELYGHVLDDDAVCWCKPYCFDLPNGDVLAIHREEWQIRLDPDGRHPELCRVTTEEAA